VGGGDASVPADAGVVDAGAAVDAGLGFDAGATVDAGQVGVDAGSAAGSTGCLDQPPVLDVSNPTLATCSESGLKDAITASQAVGGNGHVRLPAQCSLTLTSKVQVDDDLAIDGNGATIDGQGSTQLFVVGRNFLKDRGVRFALQHATLKNGRDPGGGGGAVSGGQFGELTLVDVVFLNNTSAGTGGEDGGGAIFKAQFGKLTVFNCHFEGNTGTNGGAIKSLLASLQVVNSSFVGNRARGGNNGGGAIIVDGLQPTQLPPVIGTPGGYTPVGYQRDPYARGRLCGVLFSRNSVGNQYDFNHTGQQGGGLFTHVYVGNDTQVEVERSLFDGNTSAGGGGAFRLGGDGDTAFARVGDCAFVNNRAGGGVGGAVSLYETNANFSNVTVADNCINVGGDVAGCAATSNSDGLGGGIGTYSRTYNVDRVTVVRNRAASYSGALVQSSTPGQAGALTNSVISDNRAGNSYGVAKNCGNPVFTSGANSYQWQAQARANPSDPNDPGCGAATENVDPRVAVVASLCAGRVAGSATANAPMVWFEVGAPGVSAGAACPP
jgi:hypothetical protein